MTEKTSDEKLMESVQALAKELGLDKFETLLIRGAAGLIVATGRTNYPSGFEEATHRFNWDGTPFDPANMSVGARREWVKKLVIQGSCTQMEAAEFLDVSQSTISNDLKWLKDIE